MIPSGSSSTAAILREPEPPTTDSIDERQRRLMTMLAWDLGSGSTCVLIARRLLPRSVARGGVASRARSSCSSYLTSSRPPAVVLRPWLPRCLWFLTPDTPGATCSPRLRSATASKPPPSREGLTSTSDGRYDAFFVDLQKAERDYSPTTMYRDYAINRELFHWESQSTQTPTQPRVRRWIEHQQRGGNILLFVRDKKRSELGHAAVHVPRPGDIRRSSRRATGRVHVAAPRADAGGAVRGRHGASQRRSPGT